LSFFALTIFVRANAFYREKFCYIDTTPGCGVHLKTHDAEKEKNSLNLNSN